MLNFYRHLLLNWKINCDDHSSLLYSERVTLQFKCVGCLAGGTYHQFSLRSANESQQGRNSCALLRSCFGAMLKLPWPNRKLENFGFNLTAYFLRHSTNITLPNSTNHEPRRTPATLFWRQIENFETQYVSHFSRLQFDKVL